ncbi:u3 small nucleolar RNA-interacting protein 2 [Caerostris extrusa]|uniref:U3 small nucleolar RNA-interacting protein 2 n=1 Tax=Caerostris extrusa TaxID=172846 RepID=A0AAV4R3X5_CAEEX|nr:u3 small nucleolar RNA-interacting protein 2 [Caerostris extrusa]
MPFFLKKSSSLKRNKDKSENILKIKRKKDEEISSDEDLSGNDIGNVESSSEEETEQERKLKFAKKYIEKIREEEQEKGEDAISQRLRERSYQQGKFIKEKANEYENAIPEIVAVFRQPASITAIVVSSSEKFFFSASKNCSIVKWSIEEKRKLKFIPGGKKGTEGTHCGHTAHVLSLALSSDDKYLASGCRNNIIHIWDADTLELLKTFRGHKGAITGLVFLKGSHELVSASDDKLVKLWNVDEMCYIDTIGGHEEGVTGLDSFSTESAITCGGRDNSVRVWKIVEDRPVAYKGSGASLDCITGSSFRTFISGGDDGALLAWANEEKKKPMFRVPMAHGTDPETNLGNWIISLTTLPNTDLVASGSKDGFIRLWKRDDNKHSLVLISRIPVIGFVNSLKFSLSGKYLVAGIGQEHRLGRWWRMKEAKNSIVLYSWKNKS